MSASTARAMVLQLFREAGPRQPEDPISFSTVMDALSSQYSKGTISARLSELVDEGILERSGRGTYRLVYTREPIPDALADLIELLTDQLPERTLQGTVVWDATPVLADSEDGVVAPVQVLETERATGGSTARMLLDRWPTGDIPHVEEFADRTTLLEAALGGAPVNAPAGRRRILIGPAEGLYAATQLRQEGIRMASRERILTDLLWLEDPTAGEIAQLRLTSPSVDLDPGGLFAAAGERGLLPDLFAVLVSLRERLPGALQVAYDDRLSGAARAAAEAGRV